MKMLLASCVLTLATTAALLPATAQGSVKAVTIGVLTDMSGPYADQVGAGSVVAAQMAADDFAPESRGLKVTIVSADHQNKPDVGSLIAGRWVDHEGVSAIVDLPNSGVALAVSQLMRQKNRVALASSSATSDLTGAQCSPNTVQWVIDTWALGHTLARTLIDQGGKSWYFITVDYALGHTLQRDAATAVKADGGTVLGETLHPLGASDFSVQLKQAHDSGADVIALADTGEDFINAVKQSEALRTIDGSRRLGALFGQITDIRAVGLKAAQGLVVVDGFYWDRDEKTRAFARRFAERMQGRVPTADHAGVYSATLAYLRAVRDSDTLDGRKVVERMKASPVDDPLFGPVTIRPDGRVIHAMYVYKVKPAEASKGPWDLYDLVQTVPGDLAFRPLAEGHCPFLKD